MLQKVRILTDGGFKGMFSLDELPLEVTAEMGHNPELPMVHITTKELRSVGGRFPPGADPEYEWAFFLDGVEAELVE